jgi:hypothetical protein
MNMNASSISVCVLLEDEAKEVTQFSSSHITWSVHDRSSAIIGAATLLGKGIKSIYFSEGTEYFIQAFF